MKWSFEKAFTLCLMLVTVLKFAAACVEPSIEIRNIGLDQLQLKSLVNSREQLLYISYTGDSLEIKLPHRHIFIDTKKIPYVCLNEDGNWSVNGIEVPNSFSNNQSELPLVGVSSDGCLLLNDQKSHYLVTQSNLPNDTHNDEILACVQSESYLYLYGYDNKIVSLPIVKNKDHIIPDYFFDVVVEKEKLAEAVINSMSTDYSCSYVFFTDAHWQNNQQHSPAIIKHIVDYSPVKNVLFGGDAITDKTETTQEAIDIGYAFQKSFDFLGPHLYCLFGNHDDNSCGQASLTYRHLSEEQVYSFLQSQMTDVHYWDYYNFYFDDPVSKTRFLCFDTGRWYESSLRESTLKTAKFTIESLKAVPNGWHIIAASHIWTSLKSFDSVDSFESPFVRPIIEILENYNKRMKSSFIFDDSTIYYDFSSAGAVVEYCIGGHTHADAVVTSQKGIPLISITCDGQQEVAGRAPFQTGTINEQCVTIIVNNYQEREILVYHIGRGRDINVKMWYQV